MDGVAAGSFTSIERVIFRGGLGNDIVQGGGTLDTLVGNAGDDVLDGWYGNDTAVGRARQRHADRRRGAGHGHLRQLRRPA